MAKKICCFRVKMAWKIYRFVKSVPKEGGSVLFRRKVYEKLLYWKKMAAGSTAVLLEGARRIGKSTIIEEFAKNEYDDYLILDFALENQDIRENFRENLNDLDAFFRTLFLLKGKSLKGKRCAIIFDEVQLFPEARQAIKYLVKDGRYDYLETGSLISIRKNVQNILIPSEEYRIRMFPMDFEEYLWAIQDEITGPAIRDAFARRKPLGDKIHRAIMKKFRTYMAVGGMPQAVEALVEGKDFAQIDFIKRNILDLYEEDLAKYDQQNHDKASVVFRTIPEQLENKNSHFKLSLLGKNARYRNYAEAVSFIADSMIGNECINVTKPEPALELFADRSNFKLYMGDTGLLVTQIMRSDAETGDALYKALITGRLGINDGMVMENMVAQMLRAAGHGLYFHEYRYCPEGSQRENSYEIDFLIVRNKKLCPLEVKSSGYQTHKSFDYLVKKYQLKMEERYILYTRDLQMKEGIGFLPLYMAMCL